MKYLNKPTQENRILALLQDRGSTGVFIWEMKDSHPRGLGIAQYNARIFGLRRKGHVIKNTTPNHFVLLASSQVGTVLALKSNGSQAPTLAEKRDHIIIIKVNGEDMAKYVTKSEYEKFNAPEQQSLI